MGNLCMGKEKRGGREAFSPSLPHAIIITAVRDRPTDRPTDRVLPIFFPPSLSNSLLAPGSREEEEKKGLDGGGWIRTWGGGHD